MQTTHTVLTIRQPLRAPLVANIDTALLVMGLDHDFNLRRMERAKTLMLTTRDSLCQIALACGLCDQSHLNRLFRRVVGTSPWAWRREHARCWRRGSDRPRPARPPGCPPPANEVEWPR